MEMVARELKAIVDESGPGVLAREPFEVFRRLCAKGADLEVSAALLHALAMGVSDRAWQGLGPAGLEDALRGECHLDEAMAATLTQILCGLFTRENANAWKARDRAGLAAFCAHEHEISWEGNAEWDSGATTLDCHFDLKVVVEAVSADEVETYLGMWLVEDPFMDEDKIVGIMADDLGAVLDAEFEEWCDCDDYYPPVAEDFEYEDALSQWCGEAGLKIVSAEGSGLSGGFEPKRTRYW